MPEELLLEQCRKGNASAFEDLVSRYEKKVFNLAFRLTGNREDAQDISQEAFLKVLTSVKDFRGDSSFSTWLYRVVTNTCLDEIRRRSRRKEVSLDAPIAPDDPSPRQVAADGPEPGADLERSEVQQAVQQGILELAEDHRIILVLRDIQGLSYGEIAEVLGISLGTVKSRLNRARLSLKQRLSRTELFRDLGVRTGERGNSR